MNPGSRLRSRALQFLLLPGTRRLARNFAEARRRLAGRRHVVSAFLQLDDPYSYLLADFLPDLAAQYDIELDVHLSQAQGGPYQPAPEMLAEYAMLDSARLAREFGIPFLDKGAAPPVEHRRALLESLAAASADADFAAEYRVVLGHYWRGDSEAAARRVTAGEADQATELIAAAQRVQMQLGHYNSAMLHYGGEWYWGVDRLHYLADRLEGLGLAAGPGNARLAMLRQFAAPALPVRPPAAAAALPPLEYFHSVRSPYSYLGLRQAMAVADAFGLAFRLRPVLPMVMRGMRVPRNKLLYIVHDAAREARRLGVAFGRLADPVGAATERSMAVLRYAESEKKERDFVLNLGHAIWAEGVDVATDKGMRKVTGRTGLFWPDARAAMADDSWRAAAEANRASMMASGSWGVPTMRLGNAVFWGQDRAWLLARHIEELCDTGDGILV